jgi:hypothetical protein
MTLSRRAVLVRLEAMESIVSQHPVFQALQMYVLPVLAEKMLMRIAA